MKMGCHGGASGDYSAPLAIFPATAAAGNGASSLLRAQRMELKHEVMTTTAQRSDEDDDGDEDDNNNNEVALSSVIAIVFEALRRSGLSCHGSLEDIKMEIGRPTDVRHVAHVTFDRFNGFLGLPAEFQMQINPKKVPSASISAFGVSAQSMQCAYDRRGNSVPTILLLLQEMLYAQQGLKAEGIFRINADNSQEEYVRGQLNHGLVPHDVDVHCLAGMIKAWFRELPRGVLDSLSPEQVMRCNCEDEAMALIRSLPPMEASLLDWCIHLMADVAQAERFNKMNAHNIAMVFAPNMTQVSDPLIALMHAVQVMNLLKMLILRTLRRRREVDDDGYGSFNLESDLTPL